MVRAVVMCAVLVVMVVVVAVVVVVVMMVTPSAAAARAMAPVMAPGEASTTAEQLCNVDKLTVCGPAIIVGTKPSESCCSNLRTQEGCFCQYAKDPTLSPFIDSPKARKTLTSCGIALPTCPK